MKILEMIFRCWYNDFNVINLHLGGYFLSQVAIKYFLNQGIGNLINIASIYGVIAPKFEIYKSTELTTPANIRKLSWYNPFK